MEEHRIIYTGALLSAAAICMEMKVVLIWVNFCQIFLPCISFIRYGFLHVVKIRNEVDGHVYTGTESLRTARIMYWHYACSCLGIKCE